MRVQNQGSVQTVEAWAFPLALPPFLCYTTAGSKHRILCWWWRNPKGEGTGGVAHPISCAPVAQWIEQRTTDP